MATNQLEMFPFFGCFFVPFFEQRLFVPFFGISLPQVKKGGLKNGYFMKKKRRLPAQVGYRSATRLPRENVSAKTREKSGSPNTAYVKGGATCLPEETNAVAGAGYRATDRKGGIENPQRPSPNKQRGNKQNAKLAENELTMCVSARRQNAPYRNGAPPRRGCAGAAAQFGFSVRGGSGARPR